jgi:predicted RNA-binding protein Jag
LPLPSPCITLRKTFSASTIVSKSETADADVGEIAETSPKMTPKELLDTMLGYLGFVVEIAEMQGEGENLTLQIYTEESRRLIGRNGEMLEAIQFC